MKDVVGWRMGSVRMGSVRMASGQRGVSLLEVLVSITLAMVLLSSVWSLTTILNRRFESHLQIAESSQIIRSLHQQWASDFNGLVRHQPLDNVRSSQTPTTPVTGGESESRLSADSSTRSAASAMLTDLADPYSDPWEVDPLLNEINVQSTAVPTPVLRGSPTEMTLILFPNPIDLVLAEIDRQQIQDLSSQSIQSNQVNQVNQLNQANGGSMRRGNLFKQVRYFSAPILPNEPNEFDAYDSFELDDGTTSRFTQLETQRFGLTRRETDFQPDAISVNQTPGFERANDPFATPASSPLGGSSANSLHSSYSSHSSRSSGQQESIAEVSEFRFAYFDGFAWRSSWNSEIERQLPQAIRVEFNLTKLPRKLNSGAAGNAFQQNVIDSDLGDTSLSPGFDDADFNNDRMVDLEDDLVETDGTRFAYSFIFGIGPVKNRPSSSSRLDRGGQAESMLNPLTGDRTDRTEIESGPNLNEWQAEE